jgi:hypothetical protein
MIWLLMWCRLALGLIDCAIVNAFVVHRQGSQRNSRRGMTHVEFLTALQAQLLAVKPKDMSCECEVGAFAVNFDHHGFVSFKILCL